MICKILSKSLLEMYLTVQYLIKSVPWNLFENRILHNTFQINIKRSVTAVKQSNVTHYNIFQKLKARNYLHTLNIFYYHMSIQRITF